MNCPACDFETQTDVNFCPSCGAKMPMPGDQSRSRPGQQRDQPAAELQEAPTPPAAEQFPEPQPTPAPALQPPPTQAPQPVSIAPPPVQTPTPKKKSVCWWWGCGGCGCLFLIALAITLVVALTPSFREGFVKGYEASTGTSTEESTTTEDTGTTSEGGTASGASVTVMRVGDVYDPEREKVTSEKTEFAPDTPEIHMDADLTGLTTGSTIKGTLIAVSVMEGEGRLIQNREVASYEMESPGAEAGVHFKFTAPTNGWPTGEYVIELSVDGQKIDEAEFMVQGEGLNEPAGQ